MPLQPPKTLEQGNPKFSISSNAKVNPGKLWKYFEMNPNTQATPWAYCLEDIVDVLLTNIMA